VQPFLKGIKSPVIGFENNMVIHFINHHINDFVDDQATLYINVVINKPDVPQFCSQLETAWKLWS